MTTELTHIRPLLNLSTNIDLRSVLLKSKMSSSKEGAMALDSWGYATPETLEACQERTTQWKPALLELAKQVHKAMLHYKPDLQSKLTVQWYISDGSLLGAFLI